MFKKTSIRFVIIGIILVLAAYSLYWSGAYHFLSEEKKESLRESGELAAIKEKILHLGLDLQGGIHVVMEVDVPKLFLSLATNKTNDFEATIETARKESEATDRDFVDVFAEQVAKNNIKLVRHYSELGFENDKIISELRDEAKDATNRAMAVIRNRVDQYGVSEPNIQQSGKYRIIVQLAGVEDPERAKRLIQKTALLELILMKDPQVTQAFVESVDDYLKTGNIDLAKIDTTIEESDSTVEESDTSVAISEAKNKSVKIDELLGTQREEQDTSEDGDLLVDESLYQEKPFSSLLRFMGNMIVVPEENVYAVRKILADSNVVKLLPFNSQLLWGAKPITRTLDEGGSRDFYNLYHLEKEAGLQGKYIVKASATLGSGQNSGQPIINFTLNNEGARKFSRLTGANIDKRLAIVLDNKVYMVPRINSKIPNGQSIIEGFSSLSEAKDIAIVLRAGALPAPIRTMEERTVGPTLGKDSVVLGTRLGIIGFLIVIVFMAFYYKGSGLLADVALLLNLFLVMAVLAYFRATLTLPGIAGLILTIGIAVDNNVLIFERIREELDKGKTVKSAIDSGYGRAFITILDANLTTILSALILMQFGTGPVKGFAVTLFWGVVASFFTAVFFTRTIFNYRTERKVIEKLSI
ncbi:MAG: protein translocase subunit SecD [Fidelibacterota bacterium]